MAWQQLQKMVDLPIPTRSEQFCATCEPARKRQPILRGAGPTRREPAWRFEKESPNLCMIQTPEIII